MLSQFKGLGISVVNNLANPLAFQDLNHLLPAVLIDHQAWADISLLQITNNAGVGQGAYHGARVSLSFVQVTQTGPYENVLGHAFTTAESATTELHHFEFDHSRGMGVFLVGGFVTGFDGKIDNKGYPFALDGGAYPEGYNAVACLDHLAQKTLPRPPPLAAKRCRDSE